MGIGLPRNFAELLNHMRWWRQIRVAHAQIDNVLTCTTGGRTHRIDFSDDIRRQAFDAVEFFGHGLPFPVVGLRAAFMGEVSSHFQKNYIGHLLAWTVAFGLVLHTMLRRGWAIVAEWTSAVTA